MSDTICWQYLVKKRKEIECNGVRPLLTSKSVQVRKIPFQEAKKFILEYEWLGNMGASSFCYGLFIDDNLASVACFCPPVSAKAYMRLLGIEDNKKILQLCRGASSFWAPIWAPSRLISTALKIVYREYGVLAVIAYADPKAGEIGSIYQACNAYYIGFTNPGGAKGYIIQGEIIHPRSVYRRFGSRTHERLMQVDPYYKTVPIQKKHKYLFLTGNRLQCKAMRLRIEREVLPYPKRQTTPQFFSN